MSAGADKRTYQTVKIQHLVTVIYHNAAFFGEPPCPATNERRERCYISGDEEEELSDMVSQDVRQK
jgi:hypothetical protein